MHLNEYQKKAQRFINPALRDIQVEAHALHGLLSEVGELHGIYQKVYQGHAFDTEHAKKELGDVLWMIAEYATVMGWDLDDVAQTNLDKLNKRYPNGFEVDKSLHRKAGDI